ncbi:hypothetical protein ASPWEDRAFT_734587 [Aspergillus wentii DTO 134E9]|uniref:Uncharacterized protein n=1 Tax=Aspergillus wentii DTO 134E9 TaxID=1073089 RepID=A0A1L9RTQ4_ASPWE|nr:uncharacterized protein ASPWEDRAFT_734587 [Aspergillus wentii DTO 134E9]KAI9933948.1 hypothetical protein MW887_005020 [Aspergillus wentii]OJJ38310.1 hypothetical protein ASPWEDRAFT_734587 [Aspergillus wentii DTO 134E9]
MRFFNVLVTLAALGIAHASADANVEVRDLIHGLNQHDDGFVHIADDGVARSYSRDGAVLDVARLHARHLEAYADHYARAIGDPAVKRHLTGIWGGINARDVADEDLFNPPDHLKPREFRENATDDEDEDDADEYDHSAVEQSPNEEGAAFKRTEPFCVGRPCGTTAMCRNTGCHTCGIPDNMKLKEKVCI